MEQLEGWFEIHAPWDIKFKFLKTYVFKITKNREQLLPWILVQIVNLLNKKKTMLCRTSSCLNLGFMQVYIFFNGFLQFLPALMSCK